MILALYVHLMKSLCDLHVCGDDPPSLGFAIVIVLVISTYVEMILAKVVQRTIIVGDLHVSGDDPEKYFVREYLAW